MTDPTREGPAEFPPVMHRPGAVAGFDTSEMSADALKRIVGALASGTHVDELHFARQAIDAVFAERDGLRGDLVAARSQVETVARALDAARGNVDSLFASNTGLFNSARELIAECDRLRAALVLACAPVRLVVDEPCAAPAERICTGCGHAESVHDTDAGVCWADQGNGVLCICTSLLIVPDEIDDGDGDDDAAAVERAMAGAP